MKTHDFAQGSAQWHAHRATHFNASDAPAMMGCSPYMTRTELMTRLKTGISAEVDAATQRRFDDGHRFEALARPLGEKIIGEDLYPVTGSEGNLSASFDGLTLMEDVAFEHKSLNDDLRAAMRQQGGNANDFLPPLYRIQMEQQCMVSGAGKVLFMASKWNGDELVEERHCWYTPDPVLRAQIVAGWKQFAEELPTFEPKAVAVEKVVAEAVESLPAPVVKVTGELALQDNFKVFEERLRHFLEHRLIREPKTDEDFVNLDAQIKAMKQGREALKASKAQMLAQVQPIDQASKTADMLDTLLQQNCSMAERLLKDEKERRKGEIVADGVKAFTDHIASLNARLGKPYMPQVPVDFGGCVRGLKSLASMEDKVSTELARAKIAANEVADRIDANLKHLTEKASAHKFLFADAATIVLKAPDDLQTLVSSRIAEHDRAEAARLEAEREKIRAEEAAKLQREAEAQRQQAAQVEAERIRREQAEQAQAERIRNEEVERQAQDAIKAAATPAPAAVEPARLPTPQESASRILAARLPVVEQTEKPTMKLGEINERLAVVSVNAEQLAKLGFTATVDKGARLYKPSDFPRICEAAAQHLYELVETAAA